MERFFSTILALLLVASNAFATTVTQEDAAKMAQRFLASKGKTGKKLVLYRNPLTDVAQARSTETEEPACYLFFTDDNKGFVVVAGDDIARPILGYSVAPVTMDDDNLPPAMQAWLNSMEQQIRHAKAAGIGQSDDVARQWKAPATGNVVTQLTTAQWGQNTPFNNQCPLDAGERSVTGCVATTYAILMRYYAYPLSGRGTTKAYTTKSKGIYVAPRDLNHSYQWDKMPLNYNSYTQEQGNCVAQLMADIGAAIQIDYTNDETGGQIGKGEIFAHFGLSAGKSYFKDNFSLSQWHKMLQDELDKHQPLIYRGDNGSEDAAGHVFLIDGYTDQNYYSVNWGWYGYLNGFFALEAMTVSYHNYNSNQRALFDCVPASYLTSCVMVDETTPCPTIADALSLAAVDGSQTSLKLVNDLEIGYMPIPEDYHIALDLNGHLLEFVGESIVNHGELTVSDSQQNGAVLIRIGNAGIISNYGTLTITGGNFFNDPVDPIDPTENPNYRRCIWTAEGSTTHIMGGSFETSGGGQTLCFNGKATIDGGAFYCAGNNIVVLNHCIDDTLTINGGTFRQVNAETVEKESRRCIWTAEGSTTVIKDGTFSSYAQMLCLSGKTTIDGGAFYTEGNDAVVTCYCTDDTLTINGGTFVNKASKPENKSDYRRCFWTDTDTKIHIKGGTFESPNQTLCFRGLAVIDGGSFNSTESGLTVLNANADEAMTITGGWFKTQGKWLIYNNQGARATITGGYYSHRIDSSLLPKNHQCIDNNDAATMADYPYRVCNITGIDHVNADAPVVERRYDLNGIRLQNATRGLNIIRYDNGKTVKVVK